MIKETIIDLYGDTDEIVFADGLDEAIIGFEPNEWKVVYSRTKCMNVLMEQENIGEEEALEFLEYNTFNSYIGDKTPLWVEDFKWN